MGDHAERFPFEMTPVVVAHGMAEEINPPAGACPGAGV
jgi:hypothetical protein